MVFVVVSDDLKRSFHHLKKTGLLKKAKIAFSSYSKGVAHDLALLSMAHSSIFTHGTFGIWGAFMAMRNPNFGLIVGPRGYEKTAEHVQLMQADISNVHLI